MNTSCHFFITKLYQPHVRSPLQRGLRSKIEKLRMSGSQQLPGVSSGVRVARVPDKDIQLHIFARQESFLPPNQHPRHTLPVELPVNWVLLAECPVVRRHLNLLCARFTLWLWCMLLFMLSILHIYKYMHIAHAHVHDVTSLHRLGSLRAGRVVEELAEGDDGVDHLIILMIMMMATKMMMILMLLLIR